MNIVVGLRKALDCLDSVIEMIRSAADQTALQLKLKMAGNSLKWILLKIQDLLLL